jgi:hypothetical protein
MYALTLVEREEVLQLIRGLYTPIDYAGNIYTHVSDGRLRFLKLHNYHVLLQHVGNSDTLLVGEPVLQTCVVVHAQRLMLCELLVL